MSPEGLKRARQAQGIRESRPDAGEDTEASSTGHTGYHVAALARGLSLLEVLAAEGEPMDLASLEKSTGLPKSTIVRLMNVLCDARYVLRLDGSSTFWLGPAVSPIADAYTSALDVSVVAQPAVHWLAGASGQTSNVGLLDGKDVVHVCVVEPERPIRFRSRAGSRDGTHQTGLGKVLLAFLEGSKLKEHLPAEPFPARTVRTITDRHTLAVELERIRNNGYSFDNEEGDVGVCCLAVPVKCGNEVLAALSLAGPAGELPLSSHATYLELLKGAAELLGEDPRFRDAVGLAYRALR